jgi:nucleoside-triphosphatase THEP1
MKNILITGLPGIGKTTVIRKVIELCSPLKFAGFYTSEIRVNNTRQGFKIFSLSGQEGILAHENFYSGFQVGKYGVNLKDLEDIGVKEIQRSNTADVIIIDEIGKMEVFSEMFCRAVEDVLDSKSIVLGTISRKAGGFIKKIHSRDDVQIVEVTSANRNSLPQYLSNRIKEYFRDSRISGHE